MSLNFKKLAPVFLFLAFVGFSTPLFAAETGLFWKAESPNAKTIYLFGTMHTDDNRVTNFLPKVTETLKTIDAFMMETLAPTDARALMNANSLEEVLTEKELEKIRELAEFHTMHKDAAMHMKPWLLAVVFDSPKPLTPFAQDNLLMRQAEDFGKEIIGIEDTQEHFGIMDSFSFDEQLTMLRAVLKRSQTTKEKDFEKLITAYLEGNSEKVLALDEKITGGMLPKEIWQKMKAKLMDDRNKVMADRVLDEAKVKNIFVAVGASHLAGAGGLIASLKNAGYTLTEMPKAFQ
jgi:uncharacterized protein YbaP (TraB family)